MNWQIGDVKITRILESEVTGGTRGILPELTPENLLPHDWLRPHFIDDKGQVIWSIQALVVETPTVTIIVDTCIGNDKERGGGAFHMLDGRFLADLEAAGYNRESIDVVLCTHLHVDHVGWNTIKIDGEWLPTFPNARYLIGREEYESVKGQELMIEYLIDSVRPIFDHGLVDLVDSDHIICDEVRLVSTPGHTKGHVSVAIKSAGQEAFITGDIMHSPSQIINPNWGCTLDYDKGTATKTRAEFVDKFTDKPVLILGTHFPTPVAGRILKTEKGNIFSVD